MLLAAIRAIGCEAVDLGLVDDTEESVAAGLTAACQFDALITSGGVSMGTVCLFPDALSSTRRCCSLPFSQCVVPLPRAMLHDCHNAPFTFLD